jgi:glycerol-3-phosphate acyltransferase PlsY
MHDYRLMENMIFLLAYLIGSIPFSFVVTRIKTGKDLRRLGSKNVGATNVMRVAGKTAGILALVLDVGKGAAAVWLCYAWKLPESAPAAAFAAMVGHSYPLFLRFRGGKSVATAGGAFILLAPPAILSCMGTFLLILAAFRIVSLGSLLAAASFPLFAWLWGNSATVLLWGSLSAALIIFRHKANIERLIRGTERRIGDSKHG